MDFNQPKIIFVNYEGESNLETIRKVLVWRAAKLNREITKLNYTFVSRERIVEINRAFINHDYETDIITFDYNGVGNIEGEIFICPAVVRENAVRYQINAEKEMQRVVFHGLLHLLGFNDNSEREKTEMRKEEDFCILKLEEIENV